MSLMHLKELGEWVPFMASAALPPGGKWNGQRIVEALIIAGITGGVATYSTQQVMQEKMATLTKEVREVKAEVYQIRQDFYVPRVAIPQK